MPERISSFKDLRVYELAFELQQDVFATSKDFPAEERDPFLLIRYDGRLDQ